MIRLSASLLLLGCGSAAGSPTELAPPPEDTTPSPLTSFLDDVELTLPSRLSELGLHRAGDNQELSPLAIGYAPAFELWSDGGEKQRSLSLPEGTLVDASDRDLYQFPLGTLLSKTFSYRTPESPERAVPVETRILRLGASGWEYAAYGWDGEGKDAERLELRRAETREVLSDSGDVVLHSIPSRLECRQCHESSASAVLGLTELQVAASGSLTALTPHLDPPPKAPYAELPKRGPLTTAVLGYFSGNCVHCHNGSNGAASSFDLRAAVALDNLVNRPTASSAASDGVRVVPGSPEQSVLFQGLRGGAFDVKDMPPLGVALRDERGIELVRDFIVALGESSDP